MINLNNLIKKKNQQKIKIKRELNILNKLKEKINVMNEKYLDSPMNLGELCKPFMKVKCPIKKIINVYQPKYTNHSCQGIGDFLRGSFFLLQFCLDNNIEFDINFKQHNISNFITNSTPLSYKIDHNQIEYYNPDNITSTPIRFYKQFIEYLNKQKKEEFGCYFNNRPVFKIGDTQRDIIKNKFLPSQNILLKVSSNLDLLGLKENEFTIIHIRSGDKQMKYNTKDSENISDEGKYISFIEQYLPWIDGNYLILSDNGDIKTFLNKKNPMYKILDSKICHCALNEKNNQLFDTVVDFFLMARSKNIISFAFLKHGSGFSKYAAELFNIPYKVHIYEK